MTQATEQDLKPCGTEAAYRRHLRENQRRRDAGLPEVPVDEECAQANRKSHDRQREARERQAAARQEWRHPRLPDNAGRYDPEWRPLSRCRGVDPALFHHIGAKPTAQHYEAARDYCDGCPVIQRCADEADRTGAWGVWAGSYRNGGTGDITPLIPGAPPRRYPRVPPPGGRR